MPAKDGVEIYKRFYPFPDRFRLGDPVLVQEVTGMRWPDFVQALNDAEDEDVADQVVLAGLVAVAFWQGNPQMSRDKARRAIERVPTSDIEFVDGDDGEPDVGPPAQDAGVDPTTASSSESAE